MKRLCAGLVVFGLLLAGCDNAGSGRSAGDKETLRIAVIPKGLTHEFWKSVHAGAEAAARDLGNVQVQWKGPPKEDDTSQQIDLVRSFISSGMDGIVLAPLSDQALLAPVQDAVRSDIPVVIIDSALSGEAGRDFVAYVGTDNYQAGTLAGRRMCELLGGSGTVMVLRYAESSASTAQREAGFIDMLKKECPQVQLIDPPQYAGADVSSAKRAAENMLTAHQGKFTAIFTPNESSTEGMLLALGDRQLAGQVKFVGFDNNDRLLAALRDGRLHGLVLQNPFRMGYLGVKTMVSHIRGEKIDQSIDTGAALVTPENMDTPEMQRLLNPLQASMGTQPATTPQ